MHAHTCMHTHTHTHIIGMQQAHTNTRGVGELDRQKRILTGFIESGDDSFQETKASVDRCMYTMLGDIFKQSLYEIVLITR